MTNDIKRATLHMLKGCLFLSVLTINSCGEPKNPKDPLGMGDPPVSTPTQASDNVIVEGTVHRSDMDMGVAFTITMYMDSFGIDYNQKHYTLKTNDELNKMIVQSGGAALDGKVALASDDETTIERMEEVLEIMQKNGITGYSLVE